MADFLSFLFSSVTVNFLGDKFRAPNFVGYIYFGVQDLEPVDIVCSLIKQFIVALHKPTIDNKLKEWYSRGKGNRSDYADATAILGHLMQQAPRAFLLFDAIDEFPGHTKELVHDLQMRMGRMRRNPPNVLLTSREQLVSEPLFEDAFKLEIRPRLDEISTFVSRELSKMNLSLLLTTEQENKLVSNIVSRASGRYGISYNLHSKLHPTDRVKLSMGSARIGSVGSPKHTQRMEESDINRPIATGGVLHYNS